MNTNSEYFVMLNLQRGGIAPMTLGEDDELALFDTKELAEAGARNNILGDAFGFEVFCRGKGE
jgi:hypothetical protein